jgi:hypothetical protein
MVGVPVTIPELAKDGTKVTAKPATPWSDAHKLVVEAAAAGKPISPE